jgi:RND family efflux transporter MFP subunit
VKENRNILARLAALPFRWKAALIVVVAALAIGGYFLLRGESASADAQDTLYVVKPMDMVISVLEGGNLRPTKSLEIKSQVEGQATIISVVPEGVVITPEDVKNGKVLVELDSSELRDRESQQEVTVQGSEASYTQAKESYDIQVNQNESNIKSGELDLKFARMDLEKYLGAALADEVFSGRVVLSDLQLAGRGLDESTAALGQLNLGGEALQRWRKLEADIKLAESELSRASDTLKWTQELGPKEAGGKGYLSMDELKADELDVKRRQLDLDQARMALDIFLRYEFPKQSEQYLSDTSEAERELQRIHAKARAELAKAEADLRSKEATFINQKDRLTKLKEQIVNCTIRATKPGMVVYPGSDRPWRQIKIEEGASIRERQAILTIPDSNNIAIDVKVHESSVNLVKPGQRARIVVDGFPDLTFWGKVDKVGVLPDTQYTYMNPDLKVYITTVAMDNPPSNLKPGMSAQVEIMVDELKDVLAVPIQAVGTQPDGQRVCYVSNGRGPEMRQVTTGRYNDNFIQVEEGLRPGESVLLKAPVTMTSAVARVEPLDTGTPPETPASPAATAPGTAEAAPAPDAAADAEAEKPALDADLEALISQLPENMRDRARQRLADMPAEDRQAAVERMKSGGGRRGGGGGRRGGDSGGPSGGEGGGGGNGGGASKGSGDDKAVAMDEAAFIK